MALFQDSGLMLLAIALFLVLAACLSFLLIPRILVIAFRKRLFDLLDERKDHVGIVPRLGGISFYPIIFFCFAFCEAFMAFLFGRETTLLSSSELFMQVSLLFCGMILLFLIGIADDLVGVRYWKKFLGQFVVAAFFPLSGLYFNDFYGLFGIEAVSPWIGIPFTAIFVVFITNAINLIDGIDGLASGLCIVAFSILGIFSLVWHAWIWALLSFVTVGVLIPFFYFNVFGRADRCRKIFMGDTGSLTLGYLLSFLVISCAMYDEASFQTPNNIIIAFSPLLVPAFDVVRVVFYRFRHRKPLFLPDRNHIHHKFLAMGFSHRQSMVLILCMSALFVVLNIVTVRFLSITLVLLADIALWIALNLWFDWLIASRKPSMLET